jgi:cytochrome P450
MVFLSTAVSLCVCYLVWSAWRWQINYAEARKIGLPILISPVNPMGPLWMSTKDFLVPILTRLPFGLGEWAIRADIGWTYYERFRVHAKYGEAFIIVSPGENEIILAEPNAADDVTRRRNDFIKNPAMYGMLDIYGPNLDTVNGKVWDRHRKVTVPPFSEQNSALVWREAGQQAEQLLNSWCDKGEVRSTQLDVYAVALNVLCEAGFGVHSKFVDERKSSASDEAAQHTGYRECLRLLLANFIQLVVLSAIQKSGLPKWVIRGKMRKLATARDEFRGYMSSLLAIEQRAFDQGDLDRHNLMSALVRAQGQSQERVSISKNSHNAAFGGLTEDEVYGNLFIYSLAGHDTTAGSLNFALVLLAVNPEWQDWIGEEIDEVRKADPSGLCFYEETFPKLTRCLALMVSST